MKNDYYKWNDLKKELVPSFFCSIIKIIVVQPFDILRIRIQSSNISAKINLLSYIKKIISKEGVSVVAKASPITTSIIFSNTIFTLTAFQRVYTILIGKFINKYNIKTNNEKKLSIVNLLEGSDEKNKKTNFDLWNKRLTMLNAKCGLICGFISSLLFFPLDNIRIRILSIQNVVDIEKKKYRSTGFYNTTKLVILKEGFKGLYIGIYPSILRESISSFLYYSSYEFLMNYIRVIKDKQFYYIYSFMCGAFSGLLVWSVTLPLDVIRTKIVSDTVITHCKHNYKNSFDCGVQIFKEKGIKGFYVSFKLMMIRSLIVNGVVLSMFDYLRNKIK